MAKLTANTCVSGPEGIPVVLMAGDEVPDWATDLVGEHLLDEGDKPASRRRSDSK